ncbi:LamG-like jellyroll fold domain-containing protein [Streptomyces sp. HK10]|uniref:LamG-like jellyroll fold domain-containing protein n=1 Tax=Streptomyces sp. HK10 TaxID=3373255 RepID=UPI00374A37FD
MRKHRRAGHRSRSARFAAVAATASLAVTGLPAVAAAAENSPPSRPLVSELSTGNAECAAGEDRPYIRTRPQLRAVLHDPDAAPVAGEFEIDWKDADGERQRRTLGPTTYKKSRSPFTLSAPSDIPAHTVISWRVRAHDGTEWGPWSSSGGQHRCEFVHDDEAPAAPAVSSPDYPDDDVWHDGVGDYGSFVLGAADDDTVAYRYSFDGAPFRTVRAPGPGEPVTVRWLPEDSGPHWAEAQAVDRAGNTSSPARYGFRVGDGRAPVSHWKLADPADSAEAADESGRHPATAGGGVEFGAAGPSGTSVASAAALDGTADAYLAPGTTAVDTTRAFSTGLWVRPRSVDRDMTAAALDGTADAYLAPGTTAVDTTRAFSTGLWVRPRSVDRDMTAVGQDGASGGPFTLGLDADGGADGTGPAWTFELPTGSGPLRVRGGHPAAGQWAHLAGVYDPVAGTARLYVNGRAVATAEPAAGAAATGALQIGRAHRDGETDGHWHGELAGVRAWDRIAAAGELTELAERGAERTGYWQLNEAPDGTSPEYGGGQGLTLEGDAGVFVPECSTDTDIFCDAEQPLVGAGHLRLDGDGDHAATAAPPVATDDGFTLAARVRVAEYEPSRDMAVLSLPGEHANALVVRYRAGVHRWELSVSHEDRADAGTTTVTAEPYAGDPRGQHLAVVYDASGGTVRLYVDGSLHASAEADLPASRTWAATGGLQVGRALTAGGWGEYLHGDVDEVRAYSGTLTESQLMTLSMPLETPGL